MLHIQFVPSMLQIASLFTKLSMSNKNLELAFKELKITISLIKALKKKKKKNWSIEMIKRTPQ